MGILIWQDFMFALQHVSRQSGVSR
jgi:hypothetical protein